MVVLVFVLTISGLAASFYEQNRLSVVTELQAQRQRAEAAARAKADFLANMSHELRTPMNGVMGMTMLALQGELPDDQRERLETALRSAESLLEVIDDVLEISMLDAGDAKFEIRPFDLRQICEDLVVLLRPMATEQGVGLSLEYADGLPTTFLGDGGRVRQVLTNLVGNALKFTDEGSVRLIVGGDASGEGGGFSADALCG